MANSKKGSVVEYNGDLEGLVIKVNGTIVYSGKLMKAVKSELMKKAQEDHSAATKFARCVNQVPILKKIWKEKKSSKYSTSNELKKVVGQSSDFGRASAFNKIISANKKEIRRNGLPTIRNIILPESSPYFLYDYCAELNAGGLDIYLHLTPNDEKAIPDNSIIIPIGVFCFYGNKKGGNPNFEMLSKYYEIKEFVEFENYKIHFPISDEEIKTINNYRSCIFYFAFGEPAKGNRRARGYKHSYGIEFSMGDFPENPVAFGTKRDKELIIGEE
jgi:hypothetical protein